MTTKKDEIRARLLDGEVASAIINDGGYGKSLVYGVLKELRDAGELERPSVARIEQPEASAGGDVGEGGGFGGRRRRRVPARAQCRADRAHRRHEHRARPFAAPLARAAGGLAA